MTQLHLDKPNRPAGTPIYVAGIGVFENGGVYDIPGDEDIHIPPLPKEDEPTDESPSTPVGEDFASPVDDVDMGVTDTEEDD